MNGSYNPVADTLDGSVARCLPPVNLSMIHVSRHAYARRPEERRVLFTGFWIRFITWETIHQQRKWVVKMKNPSFHSLFSLTGQRDERASRMKRRILYFGNVSEECITYIIDCFDDSEGDHTADESKDHRCTKTRKTKEVMENGRHRIQSLNSRHYHGDRSIVSPQYSQTQSISNENHELRGTIPTI